jgi:hypothetical protein
MSRWRGVSPAAAKPLSDGKLLNFISTCCLTAGLVCHSFVIPLLLMEKKGGGSVMTRNAMTQYFSHFHLFLVYFGCSDLT